MSFPMISMSGGPGRGIHPGGFSAECRTVGTPAAKTLVCLDFSGGHSATPGDSSVFDTVQVPAAGEQLAGVYGITTETGVNGGYQKIIFSGIIEGVNVEASTAVGDFLMADAGTDLQIANGQDFGKIIAIALTAEASGTATVWFDGVTGFGAYYDETA